MYLEMSSRLFNLGAFTPQVLCRRRPCPVIFHELFEVFGCACMGATASRAPFPLRGHADDLWADRLAVAGFIVLPVRSKTEE